MKRQILVQDTDCMGIVYFASVFQIAQEVFEKGIQHTFFSVKNMAKDLNFVAPIVHASANFYHPLHVGDEIEVFLQIEKLGESSFHIKAFFYLEEHLAVDVTIIHVVVSKITHQPMAMPREMRDVLEQLFPKNRDGA